MKLTLGFSPCPNDTFIFDALVNKKISTEGLEVDAVLEDVETLNKWALEGRLDITKLSFPAFFQSIDRYVLLDAGSALGKGVGPLLVSKSKLYTENTQDGMTNQPLDDKTIVLPGANTTANLLFSFAFPEARQKKFMIFSGIEDAVLSDDADLGVIIHENRFTYAQKGLQKVLDLGDYWETKMHTPIPLGGIAISRSIDKAMALIINSLIRKSLEFALKNYPFISDYVKEHSQSLSEDVMRQHIDLYVNNYSVSLGDEGRSAIKTLFDCFKKINGSRYIAEQSLFL
jgi:Predicted periplasmic solute-binding protein